MHCSPAESSWRRLLLDGLAASEKQTFLSGYLCASLFYLVRDASSRQKLLAASAAQSTVTDVLLEAAQNTTSLVSSSVTSRLLKVVPIVIFRTSRPGGIGLGPHTPSTYAGMFNHLSSFIKAPTCCSLLRLCQHLVCQQGLSSCQFRPAFGLLA